MRITALIKQHAIEPVLGILNKIFDMGKTKASREEWINHAQKGEFEYHKANHWRSTDRFMADTIQLMDSFGFNQSDYSGKTVLDLGAGSKLRSKYFKEAELIAIEPMADDCVKEIGWCDLEDADKLYSLPAEEYIPYLENKIDFVMSINVLDHCFDFDQIISNIHKYMKDDGLAFLSFDEHFFTDDMHPLILTDDVCISIFNKLGFDVSKKSKGFTGDFKKEKKVNTYGHGTYCLNYWLTKAKN